MNLIDVSDLNKLAVELENATGQLGARASVALRKTAYDIEKDSKTFCPVGKSRPGYVGGNLRNSISTTITGDGRFGTMEAEIGPTAFYGGFVENGTSRMAPRAYMGPAFDRNAYKMVAAFEQITGDIL